MEFDPADAKSAPEIVRLAATDPVEQRKLENLAIEQTDNGLQPGDPEQ